MDRLAGFPEEKGRKLDLLASSILEQWGDEHKDVPRTLYHYTSADGLLGILKSHSIWMTNLRYMNDFSELQYAHEMIATVLKQKAAAQSAGEILKEFFRRIDNTFDPYAGDHDVFATSFCENGNLLSQWRAYGDKGGGYGVGLDFFHFFSFVPKRCVLRKVIYRRSEQMASVGSVVDAFCAAISATTKGQTVKQADSDNTLPSFCQLFHGLMAEFVFCYKHPDFEQEQEWRLVHAYSPDSTMPPGEAPDELHFRTLGGNFIPYVTLSLDNLMQASRDDNYGVAFPIVELVIDLPSILSLTSNRSNAY